MAPEPEQREASYADKGLPSLGPTHFLDSFGLKKLLNRALSLSLSLLAFGCV